MAFQINSGYAALHVVLFAATKKGSSASGELFFVLILLAFGAYLWMRPQRRRMREKQAAQHDVEVGDEVVTASGIIGRVEGFVGNRVELEISPGTTIEVMRQAIARRAEPNVTYEQDEPGGEADHGGTVGTPDDEAKDSKWWPTSDDDHGHDSPPGGSS
jgi:preprotein translocase subunit YajC